MMLRGVRGAITVDENTKEEILSRTQELLRAIVTVNDIHIDDIASAIFTVTDDLNAEFPAVAARTIGWIHIPLLCSREIPILVHWECACGFFCISIPIKNRMRLCMYICAMLKSCDRILIHLSRINTIYRTIEKNCADEY